MPAIAVARSIPWPCQKCWRCITCHRCSTRVGSSPPTSPFRIAFLGVDHPHGAGWRELLPRFGDDVRLTALVPRFGGTVASLEERYAEVPRFDTVGDLIADGEFDGAIVCLSNREAPA